MTTFFELVFAGLFNAAVLFLVAAGLQLVFGVQRVVNLASGSIYALGAYAGASAVNALFSAGGSPYLMIPTLIAAAVGVGMIGILMERVVKLVYDRDEAFQLLLTFAFVLMFQDILRAIWGSQPQMVSSVPALYGAFTIGTTVFQSYNLIVIGLSGAIALGMGYVLTYTRMGHIVRATAENRRMAEAMAINGSLVNVCVFTFGSVLGAIGGALVIPTAAASLELPVELIVEAFAIVVIGGLGSIRGALIGAIIVGLMRAVSITYYPEIETIAIYLVVVAVLLIRPSGLLGKSEQ